MDVAMAPPLKRRKIAESTSDSTSLAENSTLLLPENSPSFTHPVESISTRSALAPPWPTSSSNTEQATRIPLPAAGGIDDYHVLVARQGTLLNSVDSAVGSVISSVTSDLSALESITISISASASLPVDPTLQISLSSTTTPSTTPSTTPTIPSYSESPSSEISNSSNTTSTASGNDTSTLGTASSSLTSLTSFSANHTTSAFASATSSRTTSTTTGSTSLDSGLLFFATLSNGDVSTISRHSGAYTTTLSDGQVFAIPSISASSRTSSSSTTSISASSSSIEMNTVTAYTTVGGDGSAAAGTASYAAPTTSSTASSTDGNGGNEDSTPPAGTIAGGVVGGAAGLAVVLLIAMLFVRWYRRNRQMRHQALPPGSVDSPDGDGAPNTSHGPGMAERAGLMPMMAALPAFFRHQNRSTDRLEPSERGFTRVSGRKLPSAFSAGMSSDTMGTRSPPPRMPLRSPGGDSNLRETSFYRDSDGFYGGPGEATRSISPTSDSPNHSDPDLISMSPGPRRQPQIHTGGPYTMSPTSEAPPPTAATFGRSETHSRFTEDM